MVLTLGPKVVLTSRVAIRCPSELAIAMPVQTLLQEVKPTLLQDKFSMGNGEKCILDDGDRLIKHAKKGSSDDDWMPRKLKVPVLPTEASPDGKKQEANKQDTPKEGSEKLCKAIKAAAKYVWLSFVDGEEPEGGWPTTFGTQEAKNFCDAAAEMMTVKKLKAALQANGLRINQKNKSDMVLELWTEAAKG